MAIYNCSQLAQLWIQAGGNPAVANQMASVAMAESSGNSDATNRNTNGSIDQGLWQINNAVWGALSTLDPLGNAKAAVSVYGQQGLGAWSSSQSRWGSNPACGTGGAAPASSGPSGSATTGASTLPSICIHPLSLGLSQTTNIGGGTVCMDGPLGLGAAALGVGAMLIGLAALAGRFDLPGGGL